jgi:ribokinase
MMIGSVGKDAFASEALELLTGAGVNLNSVRQSAAPTGIALIMVAANGENIIAVIPGANGTVLPGDIARVDFSPSDIILLQQEIPLDTVEAVLDKARASGARSILNTAPFKKDAAHLLDKADFVIANETEFDLYAKALKLTGKMRKERMQTFAVNTGRTIIVTLGGDGVIAADPSETHQVAALKIKPVDTVGAGDTFCGYLGAALHAGLPLRQALVRASTAGSLACLKPGAQPSIPTAAEVDATIKA